MFKKPTKPSRFRKIASGYKKSVVKNIKTTLKQGGVKKPGKVAKQSYVQGKVTPVKGIDTSSLDKQIQKSHTMNNKAVDLAAEAEMQNLEQKRVYNEYKNTEKAKAKYGPEARKERNKAALIGSAIATAPVIADELTETPVPAIVFQDGGDE